MDLQVIQKKIIDEVCRLAPGTDKEVEALIIEASTLVATQVIEDSQCEIPFSWPIH